MVGLPYDCVANPHGAVRLMIEKAMAASQDADFVAALYDKDWSTVDLFHSWRGASRQAASQGGIPPWNYYLLHVDFVASPEERQDLKKYAEVVVEFGNVRVVEDGEVATVRGSMMMSSKLHAAAILLQEFKDCSWFINLDAADYPLISHDDLLHILSFLLRDLNFVEHTSNIGWKEHQRARPIIVDPVLYGSDKIMFWLKDKRSLP